MIRRLKYHEIDFEKYSNCLENSVQKNFYGQSDILDFLTDKSWELLVLNDYDAIMPIPVQQRFFISYSYIPLFCQQLGIFSAEDNPIINEKFLTFFRKNYRIQSYAFNDKNSFENLSSLKKNYIIQKTDYKSLRKYYFKGRKSTVKTSQYLHFKELNLNDSILDFIILNLKGLNHKKEIQKFSDYVGFLNQRKNLLLFGSYKETELTNVAIMINKDSELFLLGLINNEKFIKDNGASFLIDRIIQLYISEKKLNFMGGSIRGIEVFFKSFGSECFEYPIILNTKKDFIKSLFFQRR